MELGKAEPTFNHLVVSKLICDSTRDLALELILTLQGVPLSRALPSYTGRGTLLTDLFNLGSQIDSGVQFDPRLMLLLFEKVEHNASDVDICNALLALVAASPQSDMVLPPTALKPNSGSKDTKVRSILICFFFNL